MDAISPDHLQHGSALSPFLAGTKVQYAWDSTSLGYLKTCPRLYQYTMLEGWQAKGESPHLRFGSEYHSALEQYDHERAAGQSHEAALRQTLWDLLLRTADYKPDPTTKAGKYKSRDLLVELVFYYLEKFKDDNTKTFILPDGKPAVELSFRFELEWGPAAANQPYLLSGHLDRVVEWTGGLFVMDRKTSASTLGEYYFNQFDMSNQMTLYTLAGTIILNTPIKGVIIDAAQIKLEDHPEFKRGMTYRTPDQLAEWKQELHYWFALAESFAAQDFWPKNDTACDKFGGCVFRGVCSKDPRVRPIYLKADFNKLAPEDRWNPLRSR